MATYTIELDRVSLTKLDLLCLIALLSSEMNAYQVTQQIRIDIRDDKWPYHTSVKRSLEGLEKYNMVGAREGDYHGANRQTLYRINLAGEGILKTELQSWHRLAEKLDLCLSSQNS